MPQFLEAGEYLATPEAGEILGITKKRLHQLTKESRLPSYRVGPHVLLRLDDVIERKRWVEEHLQRVEAAKARHAAAKLAAAAEGEAGA